MVVVPCSSVGVNSLTKLMSAVSAAAWSRREGCLFSSLSSVVILLRRAEKSVFAPA